MGGNDDIGKIPVQTIQVSREAPCHQFRIDTSQEKPLLDAFPQPLLVVADNRFVVIAHHLVEYLRIVLDEVEHHQFGRCPELGTVAEHYPELVYDVRCGLHLSEHLLLVPPEMVVYRLPDEVFPVGEILVQRPLGYAAGDSDVVHTHRLDSHLGKHPRGLGYHPLLNLHIHPPFAGTNVRRKL